MTKGLFPRASLSLALALGACSHKADISTAAPETGPDTGQPVGYQDGVALAEVADQNPDPHTVEISLEARVASVEIRPGVKTDVYTYNGSLPGPVIRATVGDRVIVHFKNSLPEPTTIHWHGIRVPVTMDGTPSSQAPVMPGGTFDYDFHVPDAGLYWYHPHINSSVQVGDGLYGALVVEDSAEPPDLGDEIILVLSDIDLQDDGGLSPPYPAGIVGAIFGLEGNVILVNGRSRPRLSARVGMRQRWRLVNAAKSRFFNLVMAGNSFVRIGGDGGFIEHPIESETLVMAPGERADVSMVPKGETGADVALRWVPYDRGYGTVFGRDPEDIMTMHLDSAAAVTPASIPANLRTIDPLETTGAHAQSLVFAYAEPDAGPTDGGAFTVNGKSFDTMLMAEVGDTDVWTIDNQTDWDHPFHLHGFFFQPLDAAGVPIHEWKDTFNVPTHQTRQLVVRYDDRPGDWMFHCHILEHADVGLMGMLMLR